MAAEMFQEPNCPETISTGSYSLQRRNWGTTCSNFSLLRKLTAGMSPIGCNREDTQLGLHHTPSSLPDRSPTQMLKGDLSRSDYRVGGKQVGSEHLGVKEAPTSTCLRNKCPESPAEVAQLVILTLTSSKQKLTCQLN